MALIGRTFHKGGVLQLIEQVNLPTPTDEEHQADWWNENFGRAILYAFKTKINMLNKEVGKIPDDKFKKDKILELIKKTSLPLVKVKDYPPSWWDTHFGIVIRNAMGKELKLLIDNIEKMRSP